MFELNEEYLSSVLEKTHVFKCIDVKLQRSNNYDDVNVLTLDSGPAKLKMIWLTYLINELISMSDVYQHLLNIDAAFRKNGDGSNIPLYVISWQNVSAADNIKILDDIIKAIKIISVKITQKVYEDTPYV